MNTSFCCFLDYKGNSQLTFQQEHRPLRYMVCLLPHRRRLPSSVALCPTPTAARPGLSPSHTAVICQSSAWKEQAWIHSCWKGNGSFGSFCSCFLRFLIVRELLPSARSFEA